MVQSGNSVFILSILCGTKSVVFLTTSIVNSLSNLLSLFAVVVFKQPFTVIAELSKHEINVFVLLILSWNRLEHCDEVKQACEPTSNKHLISCHSENYP